MTTNILIREFFIKNTTQKLETPIGTKEDATFRGSHPLTLQMIPLEGYRRSYHKKNFMSIITNH